MSESTEENPGLSSDDRARQSVINDVHSQGWVPGPWLIAYTVIARWLSSDDLFRFFR